MKWVNSEYELPEDGKCVLVFTRGTAIYIGYYIRGLRQCWFINVNSWYDVSHWMELPSPPDESPQQTCPEVPTQTRGPHVPRPPDQL